jgi:hypothetical protein
VGLAYVSLRPGKELWYSYWLWTLWPMFFGLVGALSDSRVVVWDDEQDESIEKEGWVWLLQGERHCNLNC